MQDQCKSAMTLDLLISLRSIDPVHHGRVVMEEGHALLVSASEITRLMRAKTLRARLFLAPSFHLHLPHVGSVGSLISLR